MPAEYFTVMMYGALHFHIGIRAYKLII